MAASPKIVLVAQVVTADGGPTQVRKSYLVDCPPGSPMETAYGGSGNLVSNAAQVLAISNGGDHSATSN
jgi:hypothetical protein